MSVELEKKVEQHEKRLGDHDREIGRLDKRTLALQQQINDSLTRVDESNRFLREQNMRQMEQNSEILQAVLTRNDRSDERNHDLKKSNQDNLWKLVLMVSASSGLITYILNLIFGGK